MEKYKNKDGIELSYTNNKDIQIALYNIREFLKVNFDVDDTKLKNDQWKIEQFNRNRDPEEWVHTAAELEKRIKEIF